MSGAGYGPNGEAAFFAQMAECRDAYRRLADCMAAVIPAGKVYDFGAGLGYVVERLSALGFRTTGFEASSTAERVAPGLRRGDLRVALRHDARFNVGLRPSATVLCTETAEHIEPGHEEQIVDNCVRLARERIIWSAAPPGQEWPGHVNLRPYSYWLALFAERGWVVDPERTVRLRSLMREVHAQHEHCADNFHVLEPAILTPEPERA